MSWSYSGNPASSKRDQVRSLIGDTDSTKPLASDEEIDFNLTLSSNIFLSAAYCVDAIAARSARSVDKSVDGLSLSYSQQASSFRDLARMLRRRATVTAVTMYAGGISRSDKAANASDSDRFGAAIVIDGMTKLSSENDGRGD